MSSQRMFIGSLILYAILALLSGCETTTTQPPSSVATPPVAEPIVESAPANPRAAAAAQQAEQQAKAIDELLAARTQSDAQERGLTIVEPPHQAQTPAPTPAVETQAPPAAPVLPPPPRPVPKVNPAPPSPSPTGPDSFKPLPNIGTDMVPANTPVNSAVAVSPPSVPEAAPAPVASAVSDLEQQITTRANENPRDVAAQLDNQILMYLKDKPVPDAATLGQLPTEDREIVTAVIDGLTNFRTGVRNDNNMLTNRKIRPLVEMSDRLKTRADLSISNAALCTDVRGFGRYTPLEPARFVSGQPPRKLYMYCELENFGTQFNDKQNWTINVQLDLVLYSNGGTDLWHQHNLLINDTCRNRRHDFPVATEVTLPAGLAIDQYSFKITITDLNIKRVAETTIPISVIAAQK